jgi:hypothetical protein
MQFYFIRPKKENEEGMRIRSMQLLYKKNGTL